MEVQDIECPNVNNLTLPEDWQLKAMKVYANQKLDEAAYSASLIHDFDDETENEKTDHYHTSIGTIYPDTEKILSLKDEI